LALVFSIVQTEYLEQRSLIAQEAGSTARIFFNLDRFGDSAANALREDVKAYTREVIDGEWPLLAREQLSPKAWELYDRILDGALDLQTSTLRQETLRENILFSLNRINEFRQDRLFAAGARLPTLFWFIAILGFLIVSAMFFVFEYTRLHALMLAGYASYTGAILYFIFVMNNPFSGPPALSPAPLELIFRDAMTEAAG
jgi:hypothetical protein